MADSDAIRLRQFHQLDVKILGTNAPQADAEAVLMLWTFFSRLGLKGLELELNSLGCPKCRPVFHQRLRDFLASVETSALCEDCSRRAVSNPLRVLDCKVPACRTLTKDAPRIVDALCPECAEHFRQRIDKRCSSVLIRPISKSIGIIESFGKRKSKIANLSISWTTDEPRPKLRILNSSSRYRSIELFGR